MVMTRLEGAFNMLGLPIMETLNIWGWRIQTRDLFMVMFVIMVFTAIYEIAVFIKNKFWKIGG